MDASQVTIEIDTQHGPARAHLDAPSRPVALLVLGHGAGGGPDAPDLLAARDAALELDIAVARIEQPYRVAGRRAPAPIAQCDAAWIEIVAALREHVAGEVVAADVPLLVGGRSMGARIACRTAGELGAAGVLCLAFPLQPRPRAGKPMPPDRLGELDAVRMPVLIVQGTRDAFGMPPARRNRRVVEVAGDHALKQDLPAVRAAISSWLRQRLH